MNNNQYVKSLKLFDPKKDLTVNEKFKPKGSFSTSDTLSDLESGDDIHGSERGKESQSLKTSGSILSGIVKIDTNNHNYLLITNKAGEIINDLEATVLTQMTQQYPGLQYSFQGRQADMSESVGSLKLSFIFAILGIYAMLAIPFQSYSLPLIVIVSIPFGIIGAIFGHILMGYGLSILSLLGIVALSGIVVNDSLVLINHANQLRSLHPEKTAANIIKMASVQRFRPIILTTMTTFFGLMPMILETSRQAKILIPMAISIGFGIVFATLITLILIPSLYLVVDDLHKLKHKQQ